MFRVPDPTLFSEQKKKFRGGKKKWLRIHRLSYWSDGLNNLEYVLYDKPVIFFLNFV